MTGSHSIYTMHQGHEIMFHISTMLPFSKDNKQQVSLILCLYFKLTFKKIDLYFKMLVSLFRISIYYNIFI